MEGLGDTRKASFDAGQHMGWAKAMAFIKDMPPFHGKMSILKGMDKMAKVGIDMYHPDGG